MPKERTKKGSKQHRETCQQGMRRAIIYMNGSSSRAALNRPLGAKSTSVAITVQFFVSLRGETIK